MEHGHDAHKSPEGRKASHNKWIEKARMLLMAAGVGIIAMTAAPAVLCIAAGVSMPGYLQTAVGLGSAAWYANSQRSDKHKSAPGGSHGGH